MIVVLDSTVLVADPLFRSTAWKIIVHASRHQELRICVSDVVRREAIAGYKRRIEESLVGFDRWEAKHGHPLGLHAPARQLRERVAEAASSYEQTLTSIIESVPVDVLPIPDVDHAVLVDRAVRRLPPCDQNGDGYRDTLNWFTLRALLQGSADQVLWVTGDTGDFGGPTPGSLHPDLLAELDELGCTGRVSVASSLSAAALVVAATFVETSDDLVTLQQRLTLTDLADFVKNELLSEPAEVEVTSAALALPLQVLAPILGPVGRVLDTAAIVQAPLDSGQSAVEVTIICETAILFEVRGRESDLGGAYVLLATGDGSQIYETSKPIAFKALVRLDEFDRPVAGELVSVVAPEDDPGHQPWRLTAREALAAWTASIANGQKFTLSQSTLDAIANMSRFTLSQSTLDAIANMSKFTLSQSTLDAIANMPRFTLPQSTLDAIANMPKRNLDDQAPTESAEHTTSEETSGAADNEGSDEDPPRPGEGR